MSRATDDAETDYDLAAYVLASGYRQEVLQYLDDGPAIPTTVAENISPSLAHTSRALRELEAKGYVELLVDEETKKGRIYGLAETGDRALDVVAEIQGGESA